MEAASEVQNPDTTLMDDDISKFFNSSDASDENGEKSAVIEEVMKDDSTVAKKAAIVEEDKSDAPAIIKQSAITDMDSVSPVITKPAVIDKDKSDSLSLVDQSAIVDKKKSKVQVVVKSAVVDEKKPESPSDLKNSANIDKYKFKNPTVTSDDFPFVLFENLPDLELAKSRGIYQEMSKVGFLFPAEEKTDEESAQVEERSKAKEEDAVVEAASEVQTSKKKASDAASTCPKRKSAEMKSYAESWVTLHLVLCYRNWICAYCYTNRQDPYLKKITKAISEGYGG